jgi:hypothetical protein
MFTQNPHSSRAPPSVSPLSSWTRASGKISPIPCARAMFRPLAPIPARAAPRTSGRVTSGHPNPPRCQGRHLRACGTRFHTVVDRLCAAPLPPPAGCCAVMLGPSSVPTSFVRTAACQQPCQSNTFMPGFLCRRCLAHLPLGACSSCVAGVAEPHRHVA